MNNFSLAEKQRLLELFTGKREPATTITRRGGAPHFQSEGEELMYLATASGSAWQRAAAIRSLTANRKRR